MQAPSFEDFYLSMLGKNEVWKLNPQDTPLPRWDVRQFLRIYSEEQSKE
jgi:hypothetical protein